MAEVAPTRPVNTFGQFLQQKYASPSPQEMEATPNAEPRRASSFVDFLSQQYNPKPPLGNVVADSAPETAKDEGFFTRLGKSFQLGEAALIASTNRLYRETGIAMEKKVGPWLGRSQEEIDAYVRQQSQPNFMENIAQDTITKLHGFSTMATNDVTGVLSGVQYGLEMVASSGPATLVPLASGPFAPLVMLGLQAGQVNEEMAAKLPNMPLEDRLAVSYGAGTVMASLDAIGLGAILGKTPVGEIAEKAALGQLSELLTKKGVSGTLARVLQTAIVEGTTETMQEAINMAAVEMSGGQMEEGEVATRLRESFFGGAAAGGVLGTPAAVMGGERKEAPVGATAEEVAAELNLGTATDKDLGIEMPVVPAQATQDTSAQDVIADGIQVAADVSQLATPPGPDTGDVGGQNPSTMSPVNAPANMVAGASQVSPPPVTTPPVAESVVPSPETTGLKPLSHTTLYYPFHLNELTYQAPKPSGSNPGGIYADPKGELWAVKEFEGDDGFQRLMNESTAFTLTAEYQGYGPKFSVIEGDAFGKVVLATEFIPGVTLKQAMSQPTPLEQAKKAIQKDFVFHAWLANWDVVGQDYDNIIFPYKAGVIDYDSPVYVDLGGALEYRAKGEPKGLKFGNKVEEIETLRDPNINPEAAMIFAGITDEEITKQVDALAAKAAIYLAKPSLPPNMVDKLLARLQYLRARYGSSTKTKTTTKTKKATGLDLIKELYDSSIISKEPFEELAQEYAIVKSKLKANVALQKTIDAIDIDYTTETEITEKLFFAIWSSQQNASSEAEAETVTAFNKVLSEAQVFEKFNAGIVKPVKGIDSLLSSPTIMGLMQNPKYLEWAKDNKVWWDPSSSSLVVGPHQPGWLPGLVFHGTSAVYHTEKGSRPFSEFDPKFKGQAHGGTDTKHGFFFSDNPYLKWGKHGVLGLTGGPAEMKIPLLVSLKKPFLHNYMQEEYSELKSSAVLAKAKASGFDSVILYSINDSGGIQNQIVIFEPDGSRVKSPYNKGSFDPKVSHFNYSIGGRDSTSQTLDSVDYDRLRKQLNQYGLQDVKLKIFAPELVPGFRAFFGKDLDGLLIGLKAGISDNYAELNHEVIHALKYLGLFDSPEGKRMWAVLSRAVAKLNIPLEHLAAYPPESHTEEKIARLFQMWTKNKELTSPLVSRALQRIHNFLQALINWGRGYGFQTAEDIFDYLTSGALADRDWLEATRGEPRVVEELMHNFGKAATKLGVPNTAPLTKYVDHYSGIVKWGWTVVQLAKKNTHIPWLQEYVQQANRWYNEKMAWLSRANETVSIWNNLSLGEQNSLANFIFEIEQMGYRTLEEVKNGVVRKPTKEELAGLVAKHKMTKPAFEVYLKLVKDFDAVLDKLENIAIRDATRILAINPLSLELQIALIKKEFLALRQAPYFPHARFGNHTIVVKDANTGKTKYMEAFGGFLDIAAQHARDKAVPSIKKMFPNDIVSTSFIPQEAQIFKGLPPSILMAIKGNLNLSKAQEAALSDLMIQWSPTQSFKNHFVRKENIPGYSRDALRSYADYFWHAANHIARLEFGPEMEAAIKKGDDDVSKMISFGIDSTKRVKIADYLRHHLANIMNPKPDWAQLRSLGFLWFLAFNVKSALVNLTQVPMVTMPFLSAHFGDLRTNAELVKTYANVRQVYASPTKAAKAFSPADAKLIDLGINEGFLDESFAAQLAGIAEGGNLLKTRSGNQVHKRLLQIQQLGSLMFKTAEKINRRVTFLTTVRLARANPKAKYLAQVQTQYSLELQDLVQNQGLSLDEATAFLAGKDAVRSTQFEYSAWARPRFMEGRKSAFFTFFMFTQQMLWFIQNSPGNTRYLLLLLGVAGVMGMPGAEDMENLVKWIGRSLFGKDWNLEKELREVFMEFTDAPPDLFLHGVSRNGFGLEHLGDMTGLPLPAVDMSGSFGMGSPIPIAGPLLAAGARQGDFNDRFAKFTTESAGPVFGIGISVARAIADDDTNPRRWDQALPSAVAATTKAYRAWKEGAATMRGGAQVVPYDRNDPEHMAELIAKGLGFVPTRESRAWDLKMQLLEAGTFWTTRRGFLLDQVDLAYEGGEKGDIADAIAAVKRYNIQVPFKELALSADTLHRSRTQRELSRAKRSANIPDTKMLTGVYQEIIRLNPELAINKAQEKAP